MNFKFNHNNINVSDLEKSVHFYQEALGLVETRRFEPTDKSFTLVFLGDGKTQHKLELTCLKDHPEAYNLGENEFHLAFTVDDYNEAFRHHKEMRCVCYENPAMGIYFIEDPDGYWVEIIPEKKTGDAQ
ncbi:MAG: VOC family protein [Acidobacteriota bacterium]|jgi:lactoylglutathione lyase